MEIKVREVTNVEEKSTQQVEQELLNKHESKFEDVKAETTETPKVEVEVQTETKVATPEEEVTLDNKELKEEDVLNTVPEIACITFFKAKYNFSGV